MALPPRNRTLKFCRTCNARERTIEYGKCIVCGNDPKAWPGEDVEAFPVADYLKPRRMFDGWTWIDWWAVSVCVVMTLYLFVHIIVAWWARVTS